MKNKKCTAIICEYNPFHNGHAYQIREVKKISDVVLCIMSGNTVQRGGLSCAEKYDRARIAVECGADIVIEHPFPYCMSSAADFSFSGTYIANALKADSLAFGHESEKETLLEISDLLSDNDFYEFAHSLYKSDKDIKNLSFAKLREKYVSDKLGTEKSLVMRLPNNILSVEYLSCLKKYPNMHPLFIQRNFEYISAGEIRNKIYNSEDFSSNVPQKSAFYLNQSALDTTILTSLTLKENYEDIYDCDYSLYNRILSRVSKSQTISELVASCTTSAYTSSKVRRAIYSIFFGVKRSDVKSLPQFTILLAASKNGLEYLSSNKKNFEIPVLTRSTDEKKYNINASTSFKPDRIFSILSNKKYSPYKTPYIKN